MDLPRNWKGAGCGGPRHRKVLAELGGLLLPWVYSAAQARRSAPEQAEEPLIELAGSFQMASHVKLAMADA